MGVRFWRFMVRDERLLSPEEAVFRLTGQPAERIGLSDRGVLRERARRYRCLRSAGVRRAQDVFEPNQLAAGMRHVLVNGAAALRDGELTGERVGMELRR